LAPVSSQPVRVAAISFLNPAPLMWDFEHPPLEVELATRYQLHYTLPSRCADELLSGRADLGLIPIASLTPELAIVPGCTIASLDRVRSIQLIVKRPRTLGSIRSVAADDASRSSRVYAEVILRRYYENTAEFLTQPADPIAMLQLADAALLIGDPALLALEASHEIEDAVGPCDWFDLAHEWTTLTSMPWVAAVWAVRPDAIAEGRVRPRQLIDDLCQSREHGLAHIDQMDHVALAVNVRLHLRIPAGDAVAEVDAGVNQRFDEFCLRLSHDEMIADFQFAICD